MITLALAIQFVCQRPVDPQTFEKRAAEIVSRMSVEDKVGQLLHIGFAGPEPSKAIRAAIRRIRPGGIILFGHNLKSAGQIRNLNAELQHASVEASGIPLLVSTDQEGGRVFRVPEDVVPRFPGAMALGQSRNPAIARDVGFATGYFLREIGIDIVLAPVLDVNNNPANPVINTRSFGSDTDTVTRIALAHARGIRESGAIPVVKHFPGHGNTNVDSHLALPTIDHTQEELEQLELVPFKAAIDQGAEIVMTAHILFPKLDPKRPATLSPQILEGILRKKLGFKGLIMTDAMEMYAVARRYPYDKSVRMAMLAGVDVILLTGLGSYVDTMYQSLLSGFKNGELPMSRLDEAVTRQLALKLERGLFVTIPGARPQPDSAERKRVERAEKTIRERYLTLRRHYASSGTSLVQDSALAAVASLRGDYQGLPEGANVMVFGTSRLVITQARAAGVKRSATLRGGVASALAQLSQYRPSSSPAVDVWLVEVRRRDVAAWNRLVQKADALEKAPTIVAMYPDSPFVGMARPKRGAVLLSFSPTPQSRQALVLRALGAQVVPSEKLVLPASP